MYKTKPKWLSLLYKKSGQLSTEDYNILTFISKLKKFKLIQNTLLHISTANLK